MAKAAAVLGVFMLDEKGGAVRAGTLTRDADRAVSFVVAESFLRDATRPILSLGWYDPDSDQGTRESLASRGDKIGLHERLPPWFSRLLPEGALRDLVMTEMGPGDHDEFDVLTRLGADLPGAVFIVPETDIPASAGPLDLGKVHGFKAAASQRRGEILAGRRPTEIYRQPGRRPPETGRSIIKLGSERFPNLPEAEFAAMQMASAIGVRTVPAHLSRRNPGHTSRIAAARQKRACRGEVRQVCWRPHPNRGRRPGSRRCR